nr:glycosyltransferase [uncultured Chitinophaga sp.]
MKPLTNMELGKPLVTVFMAVYNGEAYIKQAIESVLSQSFQDFELLIINDGSADNSLSIAAQYTDPRIRILNNEKNSGLFFTRNRGIDEARGKYFATLDCDDIAYPHRLEEQMRFLQSNPNCVLCGGKARLIDGNGEITGKISPPVEKERLPAYMFFANAFINSSTIIDIGVLRELRFRSNYEPAEDYDLFARIAERFEIATINNFLVKYRVHGENVSQRKAENKKRGELTIIEHNLKRIGVVASQQALALQHLFISKDFRKSGFTLNQMEAHLVNLKQANRKSKIFKQADFDYVLMWHWALAVFYNGLTFGNCRKLISSSLFLKNPLRIIKLITDLKRYF